VTTSTAQTPDKLAAAFRDYGKAQAQLYSEIKRAHRAGWSLRRIAAVTGVSHEHVRRIVATKASR
jgi:hypothetical protein